MKALRRMPGDACGVPRESRSGSRAAGLGPRTLAPLAAVLCVAAGCGDGAPVEPNRPEAPRVAALEVVSGLNQEVWSGRRSPEPFAVRAVDGTGAPIPDVVVDFRLEGTAGGALSQSRALTDANGRAETFLLETRPGSGEVVAAADGTAVRLPVAVLRAPGEIRFLEGTGETGIPGLPHPDSLLRVRVFDTEGEPLSDTEIWFSAPGALSQYADTTDASGYASTVLGRTHLSAGSGAVLAFVLGFPEATGRSARPLEAHAGRVLLVTVDGLRGDALDRYRPPVLTHLVDEGASSTRARTVVPSLTVPAHLSLFASAPPPDHGVFNDDLDFTLEMASLRPLFRTARDRERTAVAYLTEGGPLAGFREALRCRLAFGLDSLSLAEPVSERVVEEAAPALDDAGVELLFLHLPDPDLAGHAHGWESPEYRDAVLRADAALGRAVERVNPDSTLVMVVSDHGGGGAYGPYQHGSDSEEDVRVPLVLWGSRVVSGSLDEASILDVAPTALWALGVAPPADYDGRVLLEAFDPTAEGSPPGG